MSVRVRFNAVGRFLDQKFAFTFTFHRQKGNLLGDALRVHQFLLHRGRDLLDVVHGLEIFFLDEDGLDEIDERDRRQVGGLRRIVRRREIAIDAILVLRFDLRDSHGALHSLTVS